VYSVRERIATHSVDHKEEVDLEYFSTKLKQYSDYEYWAEDNFDITHCVDYDDLHNDADKVLENITGLNDTVSNSMGLSLQEYSRFRYLSSMYAQTKDAKYIDNACIEKLEHMFELHYKIQDLHYRLRLPTTMPIKMNTMADKRSRVTNFDQALEIYNTWASVGNRHPEITTECIDKKIISEEKIYVDK
jgi:predicted DNA-binding protein